MTGLMLQARPGITTHPATPGPWTVGDSLLLAYIIALFFGPLIVWGVIRLRRARAEIRAAIARDGYNLVRMRYRWLWLGPLFWTTTSQLVYRLTVRDARGLDRTGWARWGRTWIFAPDRLELFWDAPPPHPGPSVR